MHLFTAENQQDSNHHLATMPNPVHKKRLTKQPAIRQICWQFFCAFLIGILTTGNVVRTQQYTADFSTAPTIGKYGFDSSWPWNSTVHVTLGGEYLINNAINDSFVWNSSAKNISYTLYSGVSLLIECKDGNPFNFYGIALNYSSVNTNLASPPWLTVTYSYNSDNAAPQDTYNETSKNFSVSKPNGVKVDNVTLYFADLSSLALDNLIVGPASGSPPPPTNPIVSLVGVPSNGPYLSSQNLDFTVNFSEAVTVTGNPNWA